MVERFNRRLSEAMHALPPVRDNSRHRTRFTSHAEREAFLLRFVADYNPRGAGGRCPGSGPGRDGGAGALLAGPSCELHPSRSIRAIAAAGLCTFAPLIT